MGLYNYHDYEGGEGQATKLSKNSGVSTFGNTKERGKQFEGTGHMRPRG